MTTKREYQDTRHLEFSRWIRQNLPDSSTGYMVGNQDWILWNYNTKKLMLLEEKTHMGKLSKWFLRLILEVLDPALKEFCPKHGIDYIGYYLVQFENTNPDDGNIYLDGKLISKDVLIEFMSMTNAKNADSF